MSTPAAQPLRVLHLLGSLEDNGGILSVLRNFQTVTAATGDQHVVWVNAAYRETRAPAMEYRYSRHLCSELDSHPRLLWRALRSLPELRRLLSAERFDVLHAHTRGGFAVAALVAGLWRREVFFTNHTYGRRRTMYRLGSRLCWLRTVLLTPNMAAHYGLEMDGVRVTLVSECCADRFFCLPLIARQSSPGRSLRLVGLGNISSWKNWHLALEALGSLRPEERAQVEFHHWGPVPADSGSQRYAEDLQRTRIRLGLEESCHFHGVSLNVESALANADCFLLPSTNEPCSVALIEALALGVPAIVSASGGNVDIVQPGRTGLLFTPDSVGSLAETLRAVARGATTFATPAEIRESVRQRSATEVSARYRSLYLRRSAGN
jgi:glycosyltransferase involved in cell wall biosynthesis